MTKRYEQNRKGNLAKPCQALVKVERDTASAQTLYLISAIETFIESC